MMCRIDVAFASGKRNIIDVLVYEICNLGNTDVFETFVSDIRIPDDLRQKMKYYISKRYSQGELEDSRDAIKILVGRLILTLSNICGQNLSHCLWLCEEEYVRDLYGKNGNDAIVYYETSDIILSDLGMSGKLYAYSHEPKIIT